MTHLTGFSNDAGILDAICEGLATDHSIKAVCAPENMPCFQDVYTERAKNAEFANAIARAREAQQDYIADEIVQMADNATEADHNVVKLRIWARQWRASKLAKKKYGDKTTIDTTATVKVEHTRRLDISELSDEQLDALEGALRETVAQLGAPGKVIEHEE